MITRGSKVLFHATEKRAYFKDVRILIPDSWDNVPANITTWETYNVYYPIIDKDLQYIIIFCVENELFSIESGYPGSPT